MLRAYGGEVDVPKLSFLATLHCGHGLPALLLVEVVGMRQEDEPRLVLPICTCKECRLPSITARFGVDVLKTAE
jgi:hypothetical protein